MAKLSKNFSRACADIDEAQEHISEALLPDGIDPVKLRMAARRLVAAAKLIEGKGGRDGE